MQMSVRMCVCVCASGVSVAREWVKRVANVVVVAALVVSAVVDSIGLSDESAVINLLPAPINYTI